MTGPNNDGPTVCKRLRIQRRRLTKCTTKEKARKVAKMRRYIRDCLARGSQEKARASSFGTMSPKGKEKNRMMRRDVSSARQPFLNERLQNAYGGSGKS